MSGIVPCNVSNVYGPRKVKEFKPWTWSLIRVELLKGHFLSEMDIHLLPRPRSAMRNPMFGFGSSSISFSGAA